MSAADNVVSTPAERACLAKLRTLTQETDGPLERHSLRVFLIAEKLAEAHGRVDREALLCAALLHDAGLLPAAATPAAYVTDSRRLIEPLLRDNGWPEARRVLAGAAAEHHHELLPQWGRGLEVELLRRADLVDLTQGLVRFGLDREWVRQLRARISAAGFRRQVLRLLARHARERPTTLLRIVKP